MRHLIVGVSAAADAVFGIRLLEALQPSGVEAPAAKA